jgi:hypothetical protein
MLETTPENELAGGVFKHARKSPGRRATGSDRCPTDETMNPKTAVGKSGPEVHRSNPDTELGADTGNLKKNLMLDPKQELDAEYSTRNRTKAGQSRRLRI